MNLMSVTLNNKPYRYEFGGCGEAVYVYADADGVIGPQHASNALVIVPRHDDAGGKNDNWQEIAEVALQSIERYRERLALVA